MDKFLSDDEKRVFQWAAEQKLYKKSGFHGQEIMEATGIDTEERLVEILETLQSHSFTPFEKVMLPRGICNVCYVEISARAKQNWQDYQKAEERVMCPTCHKPALKEVEKIIRLKCGNCGKDTEAKM